jgi:DNA-directed RNA polymerase specialized sigma24 family protein
MGGAFGRSGLLAAASGDAAAWDRIVDDHVEAVWGTARASGLEVTDAAEVCQLVWLRLAQTLATLGETPDVGAWLYDATVTEATRVARQRQVARDVPGSGSPAPARPRPPEQGQ